MSITLTVDLNGVAVPIVLDDDALATIAAAIGERRPDPTPTSPYMSILETAAYLRTSRAAVDDMLSAGKLPRHKAGRRTLVARADLDAYIERRTR